MYQDANGDIHHRHLLLSPAKFQSRSCDTARASCPKSEGKEHLSKIQNADDPDVVALGDVEIGAHVLKLLGASQSANSTALDWPASKQAGEPEQLAQLRQPLLLICERPAQG